MIPLNAVSSVLPLTYTTWFPFEILSGGQWLFTKPLTHLPFWQKIICYAHHQELNGKIKDNPQQEKTELKYQTKAPHERF